MKIAVTYLCLSALMLLLIPAEVVHAGVALGRGQSSSSTRRFNGYVIQVKKRTYVPVKMYDVETGRPMRSAERQGGTLVSAYGDESLIPRKLSQATGVARSVAGMDNQASEVVKKGKTLADLVSDQATSAKAVRRVLAPYHRERSCRVAKREPWRRGG